MYLQISGIKFIINQLTNKKNHTHIHTNQISTIVNTYELVITHLNKIKYNYMKLFLRISKCLKL